MRSIPKILLLAIAVVAVCVVRAESAREKYINTYQKLALEHQNKYGIPASIKMAQALFESANGTSRLAVEANNHFGIKCKKDWRGETISHDDDSKGECFRKYASVEESFRDHSEFLKQSDRYKFLFSLEKTDYKGWAYGLKQAGYATNPHYAQRLIQIIEENKLYTLDTYKERVTVKPVVAPREITAQVSVAVEPVAKVNLKDYTATTRQIAGRTVYNNNNTQFVIMNSGESLDDLAAALKISKKKLIKYNDLKSGNYTLEAGDMVYIKAKKRYARNGALYHVVKKGETMHSISQLYAVRLKELYKINQKSTDMELPVGLRLRLM